MAKKNKRASKQHLSDNYVYSDQVNVDDHSSTLEVKLQLNHQKGTVSIAGKITTKQLSLRSDEVNDAILENLKMLYAQAQEDAVKWVLQWATDNPPDDEGQMAIPD